MRYLLLVLFAVSISSQSFGQAAAERPSITREQFNKRIEEGYVAVGGREPIVTSVENEVLEKVYALLDTDPQYAYTYLQDILNTGTPVSAAFNHALGNVYFQNGNYFQAESQYNAAVQKHPSFQRAWNALGLARYQQGDYEGTAEALANSIRFGANDALTYGLLGYCHLQEGRFRSAETAYHFAMLFDPEQTDWAEGIAQVYNETGRYEEAISVFDDLIRVEPRNTEFWLLKANAWLALDKPLKTARCIEIARRMGEVDTDALYLLGNIYLEQRIFDLGRQVFLTASSREGQLEERELLNAIRYLVFNDQHEFAQEIFALIESEGNDWSNEDKKLYRFLSGEFEYFSDNLEASEKAYLSGLELEPFNGYALMKLADISLRKENLDQAIVYYDRAGANPDLRYTALVAKASILIDKKQYRFALRTLEQAMVEKTDARLTKLYAQVQRVLESEDPNFRSAQ